jgi:S-(hydroxymethyl)glutathione dehydrogenase / alcohol dehydrogenase
MLSGGKEQMKTEAAILVELGKPLEVVDLEIPPLKHGQVLVDIAYSGACGSQVNEVIGNKGEDKWLPHCLGHEATGTVLETDRSVSKVRAGDKVVLSWLKASGIEAGGCVYGWGSRRVNAGAVTTFQRRAIVSENRLTLAPEELSLDIAVLLGCASPTGMGAIFNVLSVRPGDAVAIFGTGGIGLNACMAASFSGGVPVIGIDPAPQRRELAKRYGATHVIDPASTDVLAEVRKIVPQGVDVSVEATGIPTVMDQALAATRNQGGRAVVIGNARHDARLTLNPAVFNQGKSLLGTWGGDSVPDRDFGRFSRLLASGRFPVKELLSRPYRLDEADQAMKDLAAGVIGRPLIDMSLR